jgi:hypothetical protein
VKVGGRDATHVRAVVDAGWGSSYGFNFYVAEKEGTWFLASHTDILQQALEGGPRASLAGNASLAKARATLTGGRPVLLAHVDLALLSGTWKGLVYPIGAEMADIAGVNSISGVGFGVSLVDGGVRESVGILLDGNPRGFWRLLDALPTGLRSVEVAPPGALAVVAAKFDATILRERLRAFLADVAPGNEETPEIELAEEFRRETGFDLLGEILPALGDEAALFVYPSAPGEPAPRFVLGVDGRDEAALERLVAKVQELVPERDARFTPVDLPEGIRAVQVTAGVPYELHFAVHKRHFFLVSNPRLLAEVLTKWGGAGNPSLLRDDPMLPVVLRALNGGDAGSLAALGYVNLRGCGLEALKSLLVWGDQLPAEWFDVRGIAEVRRIADHLTGAAVGLRHDKEAVVLDCYSPVGFLLPAVAAGVALERRPVVVHRIPVRPEPPAAKASLGVRNWSADGAGVKVLALEPDGAAARGGLQQGDRIVALDGVAIGWIEDLQRVLAKKKPGDKVELRVRRDDTETTVAFELGAKEESDW